MSAQSGRPYGGKSPGDRRQDRRRRLVGAGLALFGTKGYGPTTIVEVCREAAVAPGKFYEEFDGKEAVLVAVAEEIGYAATDAVNGALGEVGMVYGGDLAETARVGLAAFCHSLLDDPRRARVFVREVVGVSPAVEERRRQVLEGFATLVIRTIRTLASPDPRATPISPRERIVTNALVGGANEAIAAWLLDPHPPPVDELAESLAGMYAAVGTWLTGQAGGGGGPAGRYVGGLDSGATIRN